jgi:uncharacterized protein
MTTGMRKTGEFCWFNMLTPGPADARAFFGELLGWTFEDMGMGHTVKVGASSIGALFDLAGPNTPKGTPPLIGAMMKVESADAAGAVVRQAGGKARSAFDVGPAGRMSVCHDPNGAEFDVWEPRGLLGTDVDSDEIGAPTWFETVTTDAQRTSKFYAAVFGWTAEAADPGYHVLKHVRGPLAGIKESAGDSPARWATYFAVRDAKRTLQAAKKLGGTVVAPVTVTNGAHVGGIQSPQGVSFFVMQRGN